MQLTAQETEILDAFRRLPVETAQQFSALVKRLAAISASSRIDWSDEWSEADLREFTAHSAERLDRDEAE